MNFIKTEIEGVVIVEPEILGDNRGYFFESYSKREFAKAGIICNFVQDNLSFSVGNTLRGLHCQLGEFAQAKLVCVLSGCVLDVAVDFRRDSQTYGKHIAVELSSENRRQLFIPRGFLHGFAVMSDSAEFFYKCDNFWNRESEFGVKFDDETLNIDWRIDLSKAVVSKKDKEYGSFKDAFNNGF